MKVDIEKEYFNKDNTCSLKMTNIYDMIYNAKDNKLLFKLNYEIKDQPQQYESSYYVYAEVSCY
jgi:hypothetical protein